MRMQKRASDGIGKGGGYFERSDPADRNEETTKPSDLDDFGRRRSNSDAASTGQASSGGGARNALLSTAPLPTKAERQKAALERLRSSAKRKPSLSPPRTRTYREKSSRSRSRQKKQRGFILSGGLK